MPRIGLGAGAYTRWVTLARSPQVTDDADGYFEPLEPEGTWCAVRPNLTGIGDRSTDLLVEMPYHAQVSIDTRILYEDETRQVGQTTRQLFVRGVQDLEDAHVVLRLICEEIMP